MVVTKFWVVNPQRFQNWKLIMSYFDFYTPVLRQHCDWVWWMGFHTGFCTITLVLYIGSLPNLATWFPCRRGRTLFILGSLRSKVKVTVTINIMFYCLIIYIDGRILWCTHFLFEGVIVLFGLKYLYIRKSVHATPTI